MAIRFEHCVFVHVPRTGGLWLERVAAKLRLKHQIFKGDVDSHFSYSEMPEYWRQFPAFGFIRHPWDWLKSRWTHAIEINAKTDYRHYGVHREFDECVEPSFIKTVQNIVNYNPGLVSKTYETMLDGVKAVYCTEDLPKVAYTALSRWEELPLEAELQIMTTEKMNSTSILGGYQEELDSVGTKLKEAFIASEDWACQFWKEHRQS